jgi:uncharacterized RDD family membrane protein YckC
LDRLALDPALYVGVLPRRILGWAADLLLIGLLGLVFWALVATIGLLTLGLGWMLLAPLGPALPLAYGTLSIASPLSATPGQALAGLVVRTEAGLGQPGLARAFTATALYGLSLMAFGLPLLAALFSARGRTLHDLLSGTLVVRAAALRTRLRPGG